jgi:hypothetical protein
MKKTTYFREKNVLNCCFQLKCLIFLCGVDVIDLDRILEHCKIVVFLIPVDFFYLSVNDAEILNKIEYFQYIY